jgi:hypothetical protein
MKNVIATIFLVFGILFAGADTDTLSRQLLVNTTGLIFLIIFYRIMAKKPIKRGDYK